MSSTWKKIQKNIDNFTVKDYYEHMTPKMYQDGIQNAIKLTEQKLKERYNSELKRMQKDYNAELKRMNEEYNDVVKRETFRAMDVLAVEILYELGKELDCYVDEPEYLEQKIDVVQNLYETAMTSIADYATDKYENDEQAQQVFNDKKQIIQNLFRLESNDGKKKSK